MRHVLIGMRGSGKTTLGRLVGSALGATFVDLDEVVRGSFNNQSIIDIWRVHGEQAWRDAEAAGVARMFESSQGDLLAIGGGAPMIPAVRDALDLSRRRGAVRVVYLQCDVVELARRVRAETGSRPSLTGRPPHEEIAGLFAQRRTVYELLADITVDTTRGTVVQCAAALEDVIRSPLIDPRAACCS